MAATPSIELQFKKFIKKWRKEGKENYSELARTILNQFILPQSRWPRAYPPLLGSDTFYFTTPFKDFFTLKEGEALTAAIFSLPKRECGLFLTEHSPSLSFEDDDIVEVISLTPPGEGAPDFLKGVTPRGKVVLQQVAMRGCTGATSAMLASDRLGRTVPPWQCNIGKSEHVTRRLLEVGLTPLVTQVHSLDNLKKQLASLGSLEISVNKGIGGHSILVDAIEEESVEIRDPYHGWAVKLHLAPFLKAARLETHEVAIIQLIPK